MGLILIAIVVVAAGVSLMNRRPPAGQNRGDLAPPATERDQLAVERAGLSSAPPATTIPAPAPQSDIFGTAIPSYQPGGALDVNLVPGGTTLETMPPKGGALDQSGPVYVPGGALDVGLTYDPAAHADASSLSERIDTAYYKATSTGTKKG